MIMITMNNKQQDERHGGQQHQQHDGDHHHHQHGAQAMSAAYQTHRLQWEGITIEVRYDPDWSPSYRDVYGYPLAHLEIEAAEPAKSALPMTETGYRSHFGSSADIDAEGGPVAFVRAWLECDAQLPEWKAAQEARRQLTLF
jgi:hypothetical protein